MKTINQQSIIEKIEAEIVIEEQKPESIYLGGRIDGLGWEAYTVSLPSDNQTIMSHVHAACEPSRKG